MIFGEMTFDPR